MANITVQVSGVTRTDEWYGDDVNVYVSVPNEIGACVWGMADFLKTGPRIKTTERGRFAAKFENVSAADVAHFRRYVAGIAS